MSFIWHVVFGTSAWATPPAHAADSTAHAAPSTVAKAAKPSAKGAAKAAPKAKEPEPIHWTYEADASGPEHWAELSPEFALCATGHAQTPIDLNTRYADEVGLDDIVFHYHPATPTIVNNGHTIQANWPGDSAIELDGEYYSLLQFHVHTPSEHRLDGKQYDMELHLVHKDARGDLAVIGVFLEAGLGTPALTQVFDAMNLKAGQQAVLPVPLDPVGLLPADSAVVRYHGSLTTPPCSEGVRWTVFRTPLSVTSEQIAAFKAMYEHNARPIQPVRGRAILVDATP